VFVNFYVCPTFKITFCCVAIRYRQRATEVLFSNETRYKMSQSLCQLSNGGGPCPLEGVVQRPMQTLPVEDTKHVLCGADVRHSFCLRGMYCNIVD
jgi:hypothetical protein